MHNLFLCEHTAATPSHAQYTVRISRGQ